MPVILEAPQELEPDDPRVNPELYRRVQDALKPLGIYEQMNFDPIKRPISIARATRRALRDKVIANYFAEKAGEANK